MKLSHLSETLIGSEIVNLGGEIREKIRQGHKIYNFTVGDFDPSIFPIPRELEDGIVEAYRQHFTNYPAGEGNLDLREAIMHFLKEHEQLHYSLPEILVASGGRPLIYSLYRAICDKDDKVIYAVPSWNNNHYAHFVGARHVVIEAKAANNFMPVAEDIRPHIRNHPYQRRPGSYLRPGAGRKCTPRRIGEETVRDVRPDVLATHLWRYKTLQPGIAAASHAAIHHFHRCHQ
jgi:aspartate aminotransferase